MENDNKSEHFTSDFRPMVRSLLFVGLAFFYLDFMIPVLSEFVFHIEGSLLGLIFSVHTIGFMISSPLAGYLTDRWSKKKLVLIGTIGRGVSYFIIYISIYFASYFLLVIGAFTLGFLVSFFWIPFNSLLSQKSHMDFRSSAFGQKSFWQGISIFVGSGVGLTYSLFMSDFFPDKPLVIFLPFVIYGIANIIGGVVFQKIVDESLEIQYFNNAEDNSNNKKNQELGTKPRDFSKYVIVGIGILFFVRLLSATNGSIAQPYIIPYLLEITGTDTAQVAYAWVPAGILNFIIAPKLGKLVDKLKPQLTIIVTASLGAFLTWALIYWGTQNIWIFAIILVFDMVVGTTAGLTIQSYISRISSTKRGKIFGISSFFMNLGAVIGPVLGGFAWELVNHTSPFIISIIVELALIPFYWLAIYMTKSSLEEQYNIDPVILKEKSDL